MAGGDGAAENGCVDCVGCVYVCGLDRADTSMKEEEGQSTKGKADRDSAGSTSGGRVAAAQTDHTTQATSQT